MKPLKNYFTKLSVISISAAILYNSWPLGHWLNPIVSKKSLASGLEAIGQPYNWLFIGGDIAGSVLVIVLCSILWQKYRNRRSPIPLQLVFGFSVLFGIGTIMDALLPLRCVNGLQVCPSFTQDHLLLFHGIFSVAASLFLFASLCIVWFYQRKNVIILGVLAGYIVFGLFSLAQAVLPGKNGNWTQDYYISLCSIWLALIPYATYRIVIAKQMPDKTYFRIIDYLLGRGARLLDISWLLAKDTTRTLKSRGKTLE